MGRLDFANEHSWVNGRPGSAARVAGLPAKLSHEEMSGATYSNLADLQFVVAPVRAEAAPQYPGPMRPSKLIQRASVRVTLAIVAAA